MDLRAYYKKIRDVESTISVPFVVVVSEETPDGGKTGRCAEASKPVAAKLIAEGRARLASEEDSKQYYESQAEGRREAEAVAAAQRMQVTLVASTDPRVSKGKTSKE
jgi:hypothetical protein